LSEPSGPAGLGSRVRVEIEAASEDNGIRGLATIHRSTRHIGGEMNRHSEFRRSYTRYGFRYAGRIFAVFAMGAFVFLIVFLLLEAADQRDNITVRSEIAMSIAVIVTIVAAGLSARYSERDAWADPNLNCPHCKGPLASFDGIVVLNSGKCPYCGHPVLDD
jgi:hypothetical protein